MIRFFHENSKFFQINTWWNNKVEKLGKKMSEEFPFLLVKKPNKVEKESGIHSVEEKIGGAYLGNIQEKSLNALGKNPNRAPRKTKNDHPTVKPIQLMSYLVNLGSSEGEIVLDPFMGSGTTAVVAKKLSRHFIGIDSCEEYCCLAAKRLKMAESDKTIQGYTNGVFWDRNSLNMQMAEKQPESTQVKVEEFALFNE